MHKSLSKGHFRASFSVLFAVILPFIGIFATASKAADKPESPISFDPVKGFKSAQSDLTEVFLQIVGSLESYGSPEPYLRHMKAEHARIEAKYQTQLGDKPRSYCPAYMDQAYFERFTANWKHIAPQLGLEPLAKNTGHLMQTAINGPDGKGTMLVDVFNDYQHKVNAAVASKQAQVPDFDVLKISVVKCLRLSDTPVPVANLTPEQLPAVNAANDIRTAFLKLFSALDAGLPANDAEKVKAVILSIVTDVGRMAESEMRVASVEESLDYRRSLQGSYSAEQETALTVEERKILAGFLKKSRFTKADLPALDKFYQGPYDRLSERGKDEMSKRLHAGMRPAS